MRISSTFHCNKQHLSIRKMAKKKSSMTNESTSADIIRRTAIDPSGHLGSFYDRCRDNLSGHFSLNNEDKLTKLLKTVRCKLKKGTPKSKRQFSSVN